MHAIPMLVLRWNVLQFCQNLSNVSDEVTVENKVKNKKYTIAQNVRPGNQVNIRLRKYLDQLYNRHTHPVEKSAFTPEYN